MDDYLVGEYLEREVQHEGSASFLDRVDIAFNFANLSTGGGGVYFHHISFVFDLIELLVHHHDSDDESGSGVKPNYFLFMSYSAV
jgi:hypothetical protein